MRQWRRFLVGIIIATAGFLFAIPPCVHGFRFAGKPWTKSSWKDYVPYQLPDYSKTVHSLEESCEKISRSAPLVFAGEIRTLRHQLCQTGYGKRFLLIGGNCAETFQETSVDRTRDDLEFLLFNALLSMFHTGLPVTTIARTAGQFAKPRSSSTETVDGKTLPSYQGDIINEQEFEETCRFPDPRRMEMAYALSTQKLNLIRAFLQGGYSEMDRLADRLKQEWACPDLDKAMRFVRSLEIPSEKTRLFSYFVGHECLLLPYEESLTRKDSISGLYYDCSAHFVWLGERTRYLNASQVEFLRGIQNPIGIKVSDQFVPSEIIALLDILNPMNEMGRIVMIPRMGSGITEKLPVLVRTIQHYQKNVVWCSDPMHANTYVDPFSGKKTRRYNKILWELFEFKRILRDHREYPGGIHLEFSSEKNLTECLGKSVYQIDSERYTTACDPRLNRFQTLSLIQEFHEK